MRQGFVMLLLPVLAVVPCGAAGAATRTVSPDPSATEAAARETELARQAAAFMGAFANTAPALTPDGRQVVFVSNRDGLAQLYVAETARPGSPPRRLVTSDERVNAPTLTADGSAVVFRSDRGADENWAFFRVDLAGGQIAELTPGETLQRDPPFLPDGAPQSLFYSARRLSEPSSSVYAASPASVVKARLVYRDEQPGFLVDVSPDGRQGLFLRMPTRSENHLLLLDMASGRARPLYPRGRQVTIHDAVFSPDAKTVFVATDGGVEQALVLALDARSGAERSRHVERRPATAQIDDLEVDPRGELLALGVLAGATDTVRLLDARTLRPRHDAALPVGTGGFGEFTPDGTKLPLAWSTPSAPTDLYLLDTATGAATALRGEPRSSLVGWTPPLVKLETTTAFDDLAIPLNVYLPVGADAEKLPVIVSYHGGPAGTSQANWSPTRAFFLSRGYAWVEPNVRGSSGFGRAFEEADNGRKRLDAFRDIETSARWVAAQPWADPDRMVVYGGSYGGYTVLVALTRFPDLWRAGVNLFGVANMQTFMASTTGLIHRLFLLEFGDPQKDSAFLDSISPLREVDKIGDPVFVYAGANDPRVPRSESDLIVGALRQRRIPVEYMVKDNEGHSLARRENQVEFCARVARFLERELR